eukprot:403375576
MLRVFTILGLAAATTMAATQNQTTEADVSKFVNETLEYVQEIKQYSRAQLNEMKANKKQYKKELIQIIKDAEQQVQLNYGKVIQPIAQEYSEFLKTLEVNAACDENCVVDTCFNPTSIVMNWTCVVRDCQCYVNVPKAKQEARELKEVVKNTTKSVINWAAENYATRINEAYRTYRMKQVNVVIQISQKVQTEIISKVPEAQECFNFCSKYSATDLNRFVSCVGNCVSNYEDFQPKFNQPAPLASRK